MFLVPPAVPARDQVGVGTVEALLPPSKQGSSGPAPPGEVEAVSAEKSIPRHKNSLTTRQGGAVSETLPSSLEQKRPHVGRPRGFLELLGAEAVPQVEQFPLQSPKVLCMGWAPSQKGTTSALVHVVKDTLPPVDVGDENAPFMRL